MIHAREWIAGEVNRRLLEWYIKGWREEKPKVVDILTTTELWFVLVQNPDGYQYTFDVDRLWRKNLRNNDGFGKLLTAAPHGVDGNRNFAEHWNYYDEGSASIISDHNYRGPGPLSEPGDPGFGRSARECQGPEYHISYHSFGEAAFVSLRLPGQHSLGRRSALRRPGRAPTRNPQCHGYDPGVGADLYTTNGEQTDYAYTEVRRPGHPPPNSVTGTQDSGFDITRQVRGRSSTSSLSDPGLRGRGRCVCRRPRRPRVAREHPDVEPFYLDVSRASTRRSRSNPMSDLTFAHSFNGASQPVQVLAKRDLDRGRGRQDPGEPQVLDRGRSHTDRDDLPSGRPATGTGTGATCITTSFAEP